MTTSSTTVTLNNTFEMATPSAFSYAQAAKGQGTPASNNNTSSTPSSQAQEPASAPVDAKATDPESLTEPAEAVQPTPSEKQDVDSIPESEVDTRSETVSEKRPEQKKDDDSERLHRPWRRSEKGTRSSSATTQSVEEHEGRKPRRAKKNKTSEKQTGDQANEKAQEPEPEPPKIELSEAPIPSVNIWQQRQEAQLAKSGASAPPQAINGHSNHVNDAKPSDKAVEDNSSPRDFKSTRKPVDASRPERNGSRGSRLPDKDNKDGKAEVPPSVNDATLWPTPETAIQEDKKKTGDKAERSEKDTQDDGQAKRQKWLPYDYVPTVNFDTPLPQLRGSKPRGGARGPNGTRPSGSTQAAEKVSSSAPVNKTNEPKDRPRETVNGGNGVSASNQGKRASLDGSNAREQRKPAGHTSTEKAKDTNASHVAEPGHAARDRPEGRGDRGRGNYRARGAHHAVNPHSQHQQMNAGPGFTPAGAMPPRAQGPYSPTGRQGSHGQSYMPGSQRGGRGGRNGSGNYHRMSLPNGASRVPPVQTQFSPYDYPMGPMSAMAFQQPPPWDNMVATLLKQQIEYYFSIENLCKDVFLRQHMDSQGFVPLHFITGFKRMRDLSGDLGLIRAVCEESNEIDFVVGEDDGSERLRRRISWETFVLPYEDRDKMARNEGPTKFSFKSRAYHLGHQYNGMHMMPYGMASPPIYPGHGEPPFQQLTDEQHHGMPTNMMNGNGAGTQLSAEVPDFSPSGPGAFAYGNQDAAESTTMNGGHSKSLVNGMNGLHVDEQAAQAIQS